MDLAKVVGKIWSTRKDPALEGIRMQLIQPLDSTKKHIGSPIIATDTVGSGVGEIVYYITAYEAIIPLENKFTLTDASIVGIVDKIECENDLI
jgi:ethanolamine utilization protein EutN